MSGEVGIIAGMETDIAGFRDSGFVFPFPELHEFQDGGFP
jgi:hypothetical protein